MKKLVLIFLFISCSLTQAQVPDANNLVAIHTATTVEINAIVSPFEGSLVYNKDDKYLYQFKEGTWQKLTPEGDETQLTASGNIAITGDGKQINPYVISSIKPTFTTNSNGSFIFSNGIDTDVSFTPVIQGNTPIVSSTNTGIGNCLQPTSNETRDILIRGYYFDVESTVSIVGQTVNNSTFINSNEIVANISTGGTLGQFDVTVTNNSGSGTLSNGFYLDTPTPLTTYPIPVAEMTLTGTITYDGTTLTKSGALGWSSQGYSLQHEINPEYGGRLEFTAVQADKRIMVGLNNNPAANASYTTISYAMYIHSNSKIQIRENNAVKGWQSDYVAGDVLSIDVDCIGNVSYLRNGIVFYTSTIKAIDPLYFDNSFYDSDSSLSNITMRY